MRVLSIDDSRVVHAFIDDVFSSTNCVVEHALDGQIALDMMFEENKKYDIVLLDWEMPGLTGPDVLKAIRDKEDQTPIMMVTSKNELSNITEMLEMGANDYVMKPFTQDILFEKIKTVLGREVE